MILNRREQLRRSLEDIRPPKARCPEAPLAEFDTALKRWLEQHCIYADRYRGGVVSLHLDYALWCVKVFEVPCSLSTFQDWLVLQGFQLKDSGLVHGLVLNQDLSPQSLEECRKKSLLIDR
jgi:hypothetical protein